MWNALLAPVLLLLNPAQALIGGHTVTREDIGSLVYIEELGCSGTVIEPGKLITAAHCFYPGVESRRSSLVAIRPIDTLSPGSTMTLQQTAPLPGGGHLPVEYPYPVRNVVIHPSYEEALREGTARTEGFDVAIIFFADDRQIPATSVSRYSLGYDPTVTLGGFGCRTPEERDGTPRSDLESRAADLTLRIESALYLVSTDARGPQENAVACFGDSGGPVFHQTPQGRELIGVISASRTSSLQNLRDFPRLAPQLYTDFVRLDSPEIQNWILNASSTPPSRFRTTVIGGGRRAAAAYEAETDYEY